jgi:hypothetical protein
MVVGTMLPALSGQSCGVTPAPDGDGADAAKPFFPENYRADYTLVRDCRFSSAHSSAMIRVWANDIAVDAYVNEENPMPAGSILVKEEYVGTTCDDDELLQWRAMRKAVDVDDAARVHGDGVDGDTWEWQRVTAADRSVAENTKATCIQCHSAPDCVARDYLCTEGP